MACFCSSLTTEASWFLGIAWYWSLSSLVYGRKTRCTVRVPGPEGRLPLTSGILWVIDSEDLGSLRCISGSVAQPPSSVGFCEANRGFRDWFSLMISFNNLLRSFRSVNSSFNLVMFDWTIAHSLRFICKKKVVCAVVSNEVHFH